MISIQSNKGDEPSSKPWHTYLLWSLSPLLLNIGCWGWRNFSEHFWWNLIIRWKPGCATQELQKRPKELLRWIRVNPSSLPQSCETTWAKTLYQNQFSIILSHFIPTILALFTAEIPFGDVYHNVTYLYEVKVIIYMV